MSGDIELNAPLWLWLFPALVVVARLWRRFAGPAEAASLASGSMGPQHFYHPLVAFYTAATAIRGRFPLWRLLTIWLALGCLVLAMAQPVQLGARLPEPPRQRDILFIVDTSVSMVLRDYLHEGERVRRIDLLRQVLDDLIQKLANDRIGIVLFAETAHTLVPLTSDHNLLRKMLTHLDTDIVGRYSALGDAVALAVKEASRVTGGERRLLMLFSDAQLTAGSIAPLAAAQLAAESQLQLYTVAIGATSYAAEEKRTAGLIYHPADTELLQRLAEQTNASSYHADSSAALEQAVNDITVREPQTRQPEPVLERLPLYHLPLLLGAVLLLLAQLPLPRRGARQ
jgi:Ca-activated chloride channel family protein